MKKFTLLMVALLLSVVGVKAKTKTTTLWEETYKGGNIEIPVANLVQGATITVSVAVTANENADYRKLRIFYCKNNKDWTQTSFTDISDWVELTVDKTSHSFTVTEAAMNILNDNTESTGSRGVMCIGANNKDYVTITKITMTETLTPSSISDNLLTEDWSSSKETAKIFSAQSGAKIGDVLQFTVTTNNTWEWVQFKLTDKDGNVDQFTGEGSEPQGSNANTSFTLEFVISTVADLVKIMSDGFGVIQTGNNAFTLTAVKLLSYSDSQDAVEEVEMGSDGIMTYSNIYNLDFSDTGLTPYYTTPATTTTGKVTLTPVADKTTWNYQGYILKGDAGTYYPKVIGNNSGTYPNNNLLKDNVYEGTVYRSAYSDYSGDNKEKEKIQTYYRYIFAKNKNDNSSSSVAFYKLTSDHTLGAHKAYLETATDITSDTPAPVLLQFLDGDVTGVKAICDLPVSDLQYGASGCYDLSGRKVDSKSVNGKLRKGIYIVNGRKVVVK